MSYLKENLIRAVGRESIIMGIGNPACAIEDMIIIIFTN